MGLFGTVVTQDLKALASEVWEIAGGDRPLTVHILVHYSQLKARRSILVDNIAIRDSYELLITNLSHFRDWVTPFVTRQKTLNLVFH